MWTVMEYISLFVALCRAVIALNFPLRYVSTPASSVVVGFRLRLVVHVVAIVNLM